MKFLVLNAERKLFDGVVSEVVLPGLDGEVTVMDNHEPMFLALDRGLIRWRSGVQQTGAGAAAGGAGARSFQAPKPILILKGLARMRKNELTILVE
jgi:F0F1-type ATP synthase epsilon subunit